LRGEGTLSINQGAAILFKRRARVKMGGFARKKKQEKGNGRTNGGHSGKGKKLNLRRNY